MNQAFVILNAFIASGTANALSEPTTLIPMIMAAVAAQIMIFVKSKHTRYWIVFTIAIAALVALWGAIDSDYMMLLFGMATLFHALLGHLHLRFLMPYMLARPKLSPAEKQQRKALELMGEKVEEDNDVSHWELVYTYLPTILGIALFFGFARLAIAYYGFFEEYKLWLCCSFVAFALPLLFRKTIEAHEEISELYYKGEHIRPGDPVPEIIPEGESISLNIQLRVKPKDKTFITFRPKNDMPVEKYRLGELFRELMWHKNDKGGNIEYESEKWEWIFFNKKSKDALDPALTLLENGLKKEDTILAKRQKIR